MPAKKPASTVVASPPKRKVARKRRLKPSPKTKRPALTLLEIADKFRRSIPPEEWARIPSDGSINYKHYLYGHPKRTLDD